MERTDHVHRLIANNFRTDSYNFVVMKEINVAIMLLV